LSSLLDLGISSDEVLCVAGDAQIQKAAQKQTSEGHRFCHLHPEKLDELNEPQKLQFQMFQHVRFQRLRITKYPVDMHIFIRIHLFYLVIPFIYSHRHTYREKPENEMKPQSKSTQEYEKAPAHSCLSDIAQ
jgi:hypothetical protein